MISSYKNKAVSRSQARREAATARPAGDPHIHINAAAHAAVSKAAKAAGKPIKDVASAALLKALK